MTKTVLAFARRAVASEPVPWSPIGPDPLAAFRPLPPEVSASSASASGSTPSLMSSSAPEPMLSEADWRAVKAALDRVRSGTGRPFMQERPTIEAVLWRHRTGGRWREVPPAFGPWWRAAQLHYRWAKTGLWSKLREALTEADRADLAEHFAWEIENGEG